MKSIETIKLALWCLLILSCFAFKKQYSEGQLQQLELKALRNGIGKEYIYDLAHKDGCNKTRIKYLGIARTKQGKQYKILTTFFVFRAASTCHGNSQIKIYDMKNRIVGSYNVEMPDSLPDTLQSNKLLYLRNSEDCNVRKTGSINLRNGLPKTFFIPCTKDGGDMYSFSSDN